MKVLAVGDIHTKIWIIQAVEKVINDYDAVVFVGDYADDWGKEPIDSINAWNELKRLGDTYKNIHFIMGNHDFIYVNRTSSSQSGYNKFTQTLLDMPENRDLRHWVRTLPVMYRLDGVTYSHAGVVKEWTGHEMGYWMDLSPIWVRPDDGYTYEDYPQVFGHTPSETCWEVQKGVWCIDTFSTYPDGTPFGDNTVLEIIDGKTFNKIKLEEDYNGKENQRDKDK